MNNSTSSYTEVTNFLMTKGVDLTNNRFLILQVIKEAINMILDVNTRDVCARLAFAEFLYLRA